MMTKSISRTAPKEKPVPLGKVRLSESADAKHVLQMCTEPMKVTFRTFTVEDVDALIESSVLAITQLSCKGHIVGFLALKEYPLIPALHPMAWEEYIWAKYKAVELTARNTMWIHLVCWYKAYAREAVDAMLGSVFMQDSYLLNICMTKSILSCPQLIPGSSRAEAVFRRVQSTERGIPGDKLPTLLIAERKDVCPRLRVRRAVEEDNDDIVPIIHKHSARLREMYGDFYVSELIARHPEMERVLVVAEHKELAVGVMCLNTEINFEALEECFELSPYAGLRHLDKPPHKHRSQEQDTSSYVSDGFNVDATADSANNLDNTYISATMSTDSINKSGDDMGDLSNIISTASRNLASVETHPYDRVIKSDFGFASNVIKTTWIELPSPDKKYQHSVDHSPNVTWRPDEEKKGGEELALYEDGKLVGSASVLEYLNLFEVDDEDLDFDIVNIDPELLRLPYLMSSDNPVSKNFLDGRRMEIQKDPFDDILNSRKEKKSCETAIHSSSITKLPDYILRYSGDSNAFLLELCAMEDDYDERYAFDMLEVAFDMFPGRDYCVLCIPSNRPPFPLLEHFTMVTPHSTKMRFINESLYVAHINSVIGNVSVRPGEMADLEGLFNLLEHSANREPLTALFEKALKSRVLNSFMLLSQRQPIGVVIVGPLEDGVSIRTQYELSPEPKVQLSDGAIIGGVMSPIMEPHARWYLRDIMRQTHYDTLFWICQPFAKGDKCPMRNMMSLAERMVPVRPRGSLPNISGYKLVDRLFKDLPTPYALWIMEKNITTYPKVNVNNSIVVVGASRTGLAFIESLIMGVASKYLCFTNLTLVSEHGLPTVAECLKAADTAIPREGRYTDHYIKSVPFCFYVDVIPAALEEIDRKKKCIYLRGGGLKYYDELILTCGQQFQHPDYLKESLERVKEVRKGLPCERMLMHNPKYRPDKVPPLPPVPENLFVINSLSQANVVFRKLLKMMADNKEELSSSKPIVVYGDCLEAYCCIAALCELGVSGGHIAFVENFPPDDFTACRVNCFNDESIDERVQESMEQLGVRSYRRFRLTRLHVHCQRVTSVSLMDPLHLIRIDTFALFYYGLKAIDINAFKAINECGLVYDGGLVVSPMFETNDPHIYGAGTCCNYSRALYAADKNHKYYNSEEVGEALAELYLHRYDPFIRCHPDYNEKNLLPSYTASLYSRSHASIPEVSSSRDDLIVQPPSRSWQPVMKFYTAIVKAATLPGPMYYMKVRKPGPDIPMEVQLTLPHQGHTLITDKNENYFRLRLNMLHVVEAVTCLSHEDFSAEMLSQLYGKHEAFFNKLLVRYQMDQIDDMYTFFMQPWMSAIYQEPFVELLENINNHEIGPISETLKSRYAMQTLAEDPQKEYEELQGKSKLSVAISTAFSKISTVSTCFDLPGCQEELESKLLANTLRSIIDNYATKTRIAHMICGQSVSLRDEVAKFWDAIGGESTVYSQIARHIAKYGVCNPHYAPPNPDFY